MCVVSTPKMPSGSEKPKDPAIIRNPFLDGIDPVMKSLRLGRSALRIERGAGRGGSPSPAPTAPAPAPAPAPSPTPAPPKATLPVGGIGRGGGGRYVGGGRGNVMI